MSQIQSSVGLISGIPIQDTVDQLIAISAKPRDLLEARNEAIQAEQAAVSQLTSLLLGVKFEIDKFDSSALFQTRRATSSNPDALTASVEAGRTPPIGRYAFTPVQTASAQQLLSTPLGEGASSAGLGSFSFRHGGFLDTGVQLSRLNGGDGVEAGRIRIRDRSGASAVIDLRFARSIDDVLQAINSNDRIDVTAYAHGDRIQLADHTGQALSNLVVLEVDGGTTAEGLGLAEIDVAADEATGQDIFYFDRTTQLSHLNDGTGVFLLEGAADLQVTLRDGAKLAVDLGSADTLGDVLDALNAADPGRLQAAISADGDRLELTDLTSGGGSISVASAAGSTAAEDLGLTGPTFGGALHGRRLQAGLKTTLLASLNGGKGLGDLGTLQLTDRSGNSTTVDLLTAETIDDVLASINNTGVGITATLNASRSGVLLTDTSSGPVGKLVVASGDSTNTAEKLGIAVNADVGKVGSRSLDRQTVGYATRLEDFAGGVSLGSFRIRDSNGRESAVRLTNPAAPITTIGGVIDAINNLDLAIEARINDRGDGILLVDLGSGTTDLQVRDVGSGTAAADLRLLRTPAQIEVDGQARQAINGSTLETFDLARHLSLSAIGTQGVQLGTFTIRDSTGNTAAIALDAPSAQAETIGDVIDAINAADIAVQARINDRGDGLLLIDRGGGSTPLAVTDEAGKTTARDLGIARPAGTDRRLVGVAASQTGTGSTGSAIGGGSILAKAASFEGVGQVIDGSGTFNATDVDAPTLARVVDDINGRQAGVSATTFFDGTSYRLSLSVIETGSGRELLVDSDDGSLRFAQVSEARDALVHFGIGAHGGILLSSKTNDFDNVIDGVNLSVKTPSETPVTVSVSATAEKLLDAAEQFVNAYNSVRSALAEVTSFDEEDGSTGILFGTHEALSVDTGLSNLVTDRYGGLGRFESLAEVGVEINDKGEIRLDSGKLQEAFDRDPEALEALFTDEDRGVVAKFDVLIERLAGEKDSTLTARASSLADKIENNTRRIDLLTARLDSERQRLLKQFFAVEDVIARVQADLAAVQGIQALPPLSVNFGRQETA